MSVLTPSELLQRHSCFDETETEWIIDEYLRKMTWWAFHRLSILLDTEYCINSKYGDEEACFERFARKRQCWKLSHLMRNEKNFASKIKAQRWKLPEIMEPDFGLLRKLISSEVLNMGEKEKIEAKATRSGRSKMLLDVILAKGKHYEFIDALWKSGQIHVINWIMGNGVYKADYGSDWPLEDREIKIIDRNFDKLSSNLVTAHGLLEKLFSNDIINYEQMEFLRSETKTSFKHSEDFLSILRRFSRRSFSSTLKCLRELNQDHVARMLEELEEEDYNSDNGSDLPLERRKIEFMDRKYEWLINNLDVAHGLLDKLFSKNIINFPMMEFLSIETKTSFKRNEDFLGILRRFSHSSFSLTVKCLRESNQDHIAELLEKGGR